MAWTNLSFSYGATLTSPQMNQLQANFAALAAGSAGAPEIQTAALAAGAVDQTVLAANAVGQSELKTSAGTVSTTLGTPTSLTLPGGSYGTYPRLKNSGVNDAQWGGDYAAVVSGTSYVTSMRLSASAGTATAQQTYVSASRPYVIDQQDGEVGQFLFALVRRSTREVVSSYSAPEAPWHYNGPTWIGAKWYDKQGRGWRKEKRKRWDYDVVNGVIVPAYAGEEEYDMEITQEIKQADMPLIPHPFGDYDQSEYVVVMADPVSDKNWNLHELHEAGQTLNDLFHDGYIRLDNEPLNRAGPPGVIVTDFNWVG